MFYEIARNVGIYYYHFLDDNENANNFGRFYGRNFGHSLKRLYN